jgi:phage-related minor tail protein
MQPVVIRIGVDPTNTEAATQKVAASLERIGQTGQISARQTAAAMRVLPAQFTDIATQLAGGQNPFLILLQQGGQIKDSFGGIGPAVKALSTYVTPLSVGIAALAAVTGGFALAAFQGSKESAALRDMMILTGNAAGLTAGRLQSLSASVSASSGQTVGEARSIVMALAASGQTSASVIEGQAKAIARLADLSGESADKIAGQFAGQMKAPAEFAQKLNEAYNFLNITQYRHILQLEQEHKNSQAVTETNALLLEHFNSQKRELGFLESAWQGVGKMASMAWDAMLSMGRDKSVEENIARTRRELEIVTERIAMNQAAGTPNANPGDEAQRERLQDMLRLLDKQASVKNRNADASSKEAEANRAAIDAEKKRQDELKAYMERVPKFLEDLRTANQRAAIQLIADERTKGEALIALDRQTALDRNKQQKLNAADLRQANAAAEAQAIIARAALNAKLSAEAAKDPLGDFINERVLPDDQKRAERRLQIADEFLMSLADANERAGIELMTDEARRAEALIELDRRTTIERAKAKGLTGTDLTYAENLADNGANLARDKLKAKESERTGAMVYGDLRGSIEAALLDSRNPIQTFAQTLGQAVRKRLMDSLADSLTTQLVGKDGLSGLLGMFLGSSITGARAGGGRVDAYGTYLVGEKGPELLQLGATGGNIVSSGPTAQALHSRAGTSIDASINGLSVGAGVSMPQVQSMLNRALVVQREQIMRTLRQQGAAA